MYIFLHSTANFEIFFIILITLKDNVKNFKMLSLII